MTKYEMEEILLDNELLSNEALNLIIKINGDKAQTYLDILYATTGYRTFESYEDSI